MVDVMYGCDGWDSAGTTKTVHIKVMDADSADFV
jgi:hypothetical protein